MTAAVTVAPTLQVALVTAVVVDVEQEEEDEGLEASRHPRGARCRCLVGKNGAMRGLG